MFYAISRAPKMHEKIFQHCDFERNRCRQNDSIYPYWALKRLQQTYNNFKYLTFYNISNVTPEIWIDTVDADVSYCIVVDAVCDAMLQIKNLQASMVDYHEIVVLILVLSVTPISSFRMVLYTYDCLNHCWVLWGKFICPKKT